MKELIKRGIPHKYIYVQIKENKEYLENHLQELRLEDEKKISNAMENGTYDSKE